MTLALHLVKIAQVTLLLSDFSWFGGGDDVSTHLRPYAIQDPNPRFRFFLLCPKISTSATGHLPG